MKLVFLLAPFALFGQLLNSDPTIAGALNYCVSSSAANTYTCSLATPVTTLTDGQEFLVRLANAPSGNFTINIDSTGAIAVKKISGGSIVNAGSGDVVANQLFRVAYRAAAAEFHILGAVGSAGGGVTVSGGRWTPYHSGARTFSSNTAGTVRVWSEFVPFTMTVTKVAFEVVTASGTGCSGGTCGLLFGIYSTDGNTLKCFGRATGGGTPDINSTGDKLLTLSSSCSLSAGELVRIVLATDSTNLQIRAADYTPTITIINADGAYWGTCPNSATGNGASIAFASTCGTLSATGVVQPPYISWSN